MKTKFWLYEENFQTHFEYKIQTYEDQIFSVFIRLINNYSFFEYGILVLGSTLESGKESAEIFEISDPKNTYFSTTLFNCSEKAIFVSFKSKIWNVGPKWKLGDKCDEVPEIKNSEILHFDTSFDFTN